MIHILGLGAGMYILNHFIGPDRRGEQGARGEKGSAGAQGLLGHRGEQGARGEKGERGELGGVLEHTSQNQMIDRLDDKLSAHIRRTPSVVREVLFSKKTGEIATRKYNERMKQEENGVVSEELEHLKFKRYDVPMYPLPPQS